MAKAPDVIKYIAMYGSKAISASAPSFFTNFIGSPALENQVIAYLKQKGVNLYYLSNTNFVTNGGFLGTTFTNTFKGQLKAFAQKCYDNGITLGTVAGIAYTDGGGNRVYNAGPAARVVDYNQGATAQQKLTNFLIEEEYWRTGLGNMTFSQFKAACQTIYNTLHPTGVSVDAYLVRRNPTEFAQLAPYLDIFWMTTYLVASRDNQVRYDAIHSWVVELAATTPSTPIKVGALMSLESYSYNKTGGNDANSNFLGYQSEGRRINAPFLSPQPIVTSPKNFNQLADKITHNGTVGLPPIDFNSEPTSVTDYIDWQGIQVFDYDLAPHLNIVDANNTEVWALGDGAVTTAPEFAIAKQVAAMVPYNAARFLYLGDVYFTGTQAEYIDPSISFDAAYGSQSGHNLNILTSAAMGAHEWANRSVGYDKYWSGGLAGVGSMNPVWDGSRTSVNPHYYSFYLSSGTQKWKFICINTMEDGFANGGVLSGSPMYNWLVTELADSSVGRRKIVFCHHTRFSADGAYGDNPNMQPLWAAMQGNAMILLSGHIHNYQRMNMRDAAGNVVVGGGVYQVVSGTGGSAPYGIIGGYLSGAVAFSAANNGATRLTLHDDHVDVCFVRNDGVVLDCASLPVATTIPPIVDAGPNQSITLPATATMAGSATDTNSPSLILTNIWTKTSGTGNVSFSNPNSLTAVATFSAAGTYVLRLTSNNGVNSSFDEMTVTVAAAVASKTLTIQSLPTGVAMTLSIADINGNQNGTTNFSRVYLTASAPTITAPSTFGAYVFLKWVKDGVDYSFGTTITASDILSHVFEAVYELTPNIAYAITINSSPANALGVTGTFSGNTPLYGYVHGGDIITLNAPLTFGGRAFVEWQLNGITLSASRNTTDTVTSDATYTAVYAPTGGELNLILFAEYIGTFLNPILLTFGATVAATITLSNDSTGVIYSGAIGGGGAQIYVEGDYTYTLLADNGSGKTATTKIYVPRQAAPSASVTTVQPTTVGGNGYYSIIAPSSIPPCDVAPLGEGIAAGVLYTSSLLPAGSYSTVIGPSVLNQPNKINRIVDGDLTTNPFSSGWTGNNASVVYNSGTKTIDIAALFSATITVPISAPQIKSTDRLYIGVWHSGAVNSDGNGLSLNYNGSLIVNGASEQPEFLSIDVTGVTNVNTIVIKTNGSVTVPLKIYKVVVQVENMLFQSTIIDVPSITATSVINNVTCNGGQNGRIALTVSGGVPPYDYAWSKTGFPSNVYLNSPTISSLDAGTYNVLITDNNGNTYSNSYTITQPSAITVSLAITNVTCKGADNGTVVFTPSGGTGPYTYILDGATVGSTVIDIPVGPHIYSVSDANGCTVTGSFTITEPTALTSSLVISDATCYNSATGQVVVTAGGGTPTYLYSYDGAGYISSNTKTGLLAGGHSVIVKDANGCLKSTDYSITEPSDITIVKTVVNPSYGGASDGSIGLAISGGVFPTVVTWADGTVFNLSSSGSILYDGLQAGTYTATVVDANGCSKPVSQVLTDAPDVPPVNPPSDVDVDRFVILANCCLGDKIYEVFKGYANGHVQLDCLAYPAMLLSEKVQLLRKWYSLGRTIGGKKGEFVFNIAVFSNNVFTISLAGLPTVTYTGDAFISYNANMALLITALTTAGYDAEYESDSGYIFIYSPMNSFYNGLMVNVTAENGSGNPIRNGVVSKNGFMGAVTPCVTDEKFTPNCLDVNDKNLLIEQIRLACDSCLCGDYKIKDTL